MLRINVAMPRPLGPPSVGIVSSIAKQRVVAEHLRLTELNLEGDDQSDRTVHGGVDKAVYAYPSEHLPAWAADLHQPDLPDSPTAPFGENISTLGATEGDTCIGDIWRWGTAMLQVAQPRWPCQKLTVHRRSASVGGLMRSTGRTGWYLRVLQPGTVDVAGPITVVERHPATLSVRAANDAMLDRSLPRPPEDRGARGTRRCAGRRVAVATRRTPSRHPSKMTSRTDSKGPPQASSEW